MQMRIALLEDNEEQADLVKNWVKSWGYFCHHFACSADLLKNIVSESYDVYLVDWELPDINGNEVVRRLREEYRCQDAIIFVTSRDSETDIVTGLEAGADDYLVKPLKQHELKARILAVSRRLKRPETETSSIEFPPYEFNTQSETVTLSGQALTLTSKEFQVALFLFNNAGRVLSRGHILERIWGKRADLNTRTVDTHVSSIRQKLKIRPDTGWKLSSIYRHGYRLEKLDGDANNGA